MGYTYKWALGSVLNPEESVIAQWFLIHSSGHLTVFSALYEHGQREK